MTASEEDRDVNGDPAGEAWRQPSDVAAPSVAPADPAAGVPSVSLFLQLPPDLGSVAFVRHVTRQSLAAAGATRDALDDVELALSEACTNVLNHAGAGTGYEVTVVVQGDRCRLEVVDAGRGFDHRDRERVGSAAGEPERGRGLPIIAAVMDEVELVSGPERGTRVTLTKRLTFEPGATAHGAPAHEATAEAAPQGEG